MSSSRHPFIFVLLCVLSFPHVLSRTLEQIPKTSFLDVSTSIKKTFEIVSFNPQTLRQQDEATESNSPYTLKLYSRDTLHTPPFKSYRDLTLSRLQRDSSRVNLLSKILNKPMDAEAPVTSGASLGTGEYLARIGFGTPAKQLYTIIDTGSDITWIQCSPCTMCYSQTDPIFDPSKSSSYKPLTCDSQLCSELSHSSCNGNCSYQVSYGDSSSTSGDFVQETLTLGKSGIKNIGIGCGHDNEGTISGAGGLLGLGGGSLSFPSQINESAFSYCLVDKDSTTSSTIEFGSSSSDDAVSVPLLKGSMATFYYVGLTGISVGGKKLPISSSAFAIDPSSGEGGVIVDSGTTVSRFSKEVYQVLRDAFVEGARGLRAVPSPFNVLDTCYDLESITGVQVPAVTFLFGSKSLSLPAKNVLVPVDHNVFCFAFATLAQPVSIIGNMQQQGMRVTHDLGRSLIGFTPNKC